MNNWNGMAIPGLAGRMGAISPFSTSQYTNMTPMQSMSLTPATIAPIQSLDNPAYRMPSVTPIGGAENSGWFGIEGLGKNVGTLKMGLDILGGAAGVWNAAQQNKLAKQNFKYQTGLMDTNLQNSMRAFNLALDDKMRSRQVVEGLSDNERQAFMDRYSARDERRK